MQCTQPATISRVGIRSFHQKPLCKARALMPHCVYEWSFAAEHLIDLCAISSDKLCRNEIIRVNQCEHALIWIGSRPQERGMARKSDQRYGYWQFSDGQCQQ
jgi:hypothetical protein